MLALMAMVAVGTWEMPTSVDPELVREVETLVGEEADLAMSAPVIEDVAQQLGLEPGMDPDQGLRRRLPVLAVRFTWGTHAHPGRKQWEIVFFVTWLLGP